MDRNALENLKVVEYVCTVAGAYCGKLMADPGADVIIIESPEKRPSENPVGALGL